MGGRENCVHDSNGANVCYKNKGRIGCLNDLKSWASKGNYLKIFNCIRKVKRRISRKVIIKIIVTIRSTVEERRDVTIRSIRTKRRWC